MTSSKMSRSLETTCFIFFWTTVGFKFISCSLTVPELVYRTGNSFEDGAPFTAMDHVVYDGIVLPQRRQIENTPVNYAFAPASASFVRESLKLDRKSESHYETTDPAGAIFSREWRPENSFVRESKSDENSRPNYETTDPTNAVFSGQRQFEDPGRVIPKTRDEIVEDVLNSLLTLLVEEHANDDDRAKGCDNVRSFDAVENINKRSVVYDMDDDKVGHTEPRIWSSKNRTRDEGRQSFFETGAIVSDFDDPRYLIFSNNADEVGNLKPVPMFPSTAHMVSIPTPTLYSLSQPALHPFSVPLPPVNVFPYSSDAAPMITHTYGFDFAPTVLPGWNPIPNLPQYSAPFLYPNLEAAMRPTSAFSTMGIRFIPPLNSYEKQLENKIKPGGIDVKKPATDENGVRMPEDVKNVTSASLESKKPVQEEIDPSEGKIISAEDKQHVNSSTVEWESEKTPSGQNSTTSDIGASNVKPSLQKISGTPKPVAATNLTANNIDVLTELGRTPSVNSSLNNGRPASTKIRRDNVLLQVARMKNGEGKSSSEEKNNCSKAKSGSPVTIAKSNSPVTISSRSNEKLQVLIAKHRARVHQILVPEKPARRGSRNNQPKSGTDNHQSK